MGHPLSVGLMLVSVQWFLYLLCSHLCGAGGLPCFWMVCHSSMKFYPYLFPPWWAFQSGFGCHCCVCTLPMNGSGLFSSLHLFFVGVLGLVFFFFFIFFFVFFCFLFFVFCFFFFWFESNDVVVFFFIF